MAQPDDKGVEMALTARRNRLAAIAIATAVASSLAPGAAASSEEMYVNPSTGYATPAPPSGETVRADRSIEPLTAGDSSSGFDWGSAGIGAAGGGGLVLVLTLSAATVGVGGLRRARRVSG
jgi:hypothetical protein